MIQRPSSIAQLSECFASFKQMRETKPVSYDEAIKCWHLVSYQEVLQVLTDTTHFVAREPDKTGSSSSTHPFSRTQVQTLLSTAFTSQVVDTLAPRTQEIAQRLLDQVRPIGTMDVIGDFAKPLSLSLLADLLDIPAHQILSFREWLHQEQKRAGELLIAAELEQSSSLPLEANAFFHDLFSERRRQPRQDLISHLFTATIEGANVSETDIMSCCLWLLTIGYETAMHLLGNAVLCIDAYPRVAERLHQQPVPIYSTIEEVLRFLPPLWLVSRITTSEVVLGTERLPSGARVCAWIASANRDAKYFSQPDTFDIERIPNRHLSFGNGKSFRFDAALARLQTEIGLSLLLQQFPDLKVLPDQSIEVVDNPFVFGVKHLLVTFTLTP